jgi:tetratricopeptide (TPR) repeat protein
MAPPRRRLGVLFLLLVVASGAGVLLRRQLLTPRRSAEEVSPAVLVAAGTALAHERHWLDAAELVRAAVRAGVDTAAAHRTLGVCLGELGWIEATIREYEQAIRLEPSYIDTYISLATAYRSIGRRREALRTLSRAEAQLASSMPRAAAGRYSRPVAPKLEALAQNYAYLGELRQSLYWAEQARTADPTRASGYLLVGKCQLALKQPALAIAPLRRACGLLEEDADAHYTLAIALRERPSRDHGAEALRHLATAASLDARLAPALFQLGILYAGRRQWPEAQRAFLTACRLQFEPAECLRRAGEACRQAGNAACAEELLGQHAERSGDYTGALEHYRRLGALPGYRVLAYRRSAAALGRMGRHRQAIDTLKQAIDLQSNPGDLYRQLAGACSKAQRVNEQVEALHQAARLDPEQAHGDFYLLGQLAFDAGKYDEAERYLEKSVELQPGSSKYQYMLGRTYLTGPENGDRLTRAIARLETAQRLAPQQGYAHDFLSVAYLKAQRWPEAAAALHHAIDLAPDNGLLYFRLGQVYQHLGRTDEAKWVLGLYQRLRKYEADRDLLERGVRARPKSAGAHAALAGLLLRGREYDKAEYELYKVLELDPANSDAHEKLAVIDGETGRPEAQQRHLEEARRLMDRGTRS